ncbi:site-specific DNA-methyltransferase [Pseudarthrobacter niigatensis]|uniref:Adenine-specific DNA-methyltransferase n=1 Tax=Pseudarthrobacter niigatensis TaxID=369935 RepID=A0AAJ1SSM0_9MICC|nr:site-specific DNA-methyltransferase [Pseudarthrobacter niigatensis]MDQ0144968.1 adenine-specific DNA-methyltransferase [Pseudarthrobacter niigatensis]MDQ0264405.1 adenine-specific DNA-methyltransferase [Pseudarthrobacter niigatensis]
MPPRKNTLSPTPVESVHHADKRKNIPTADAHHFVTEEMEQPKSLLYPRDPSLDPQLVWKGKDELDSSDLVIDAPPIYIQEKIDSRVLVENLRKTAKETGPEPEETLFDLFDGLDEYSAVDFYQHEANWSNRMILGDSLQVMGSLAERENLRGQVQMVFIDPPYGIKFGSNWQSSTRKRSVADGKLSDAAREAEQIKAFRDTWELGIHSYLGYLRDRLIASRDLLTESGSIFVQIGDENVHLVRSLVDEVFGSENSMALIPFKKTSAVNGLGLDGVNDYLIWYAKDKSVAKYRQLYSDSDLSFSAFPYFDGERGGERSTPSKPGTPSARFRTDNLTSQSGGATTSFTVTHDGVDYLPSRGNFWKTNETGMQRLRQAGRLEGNGKTLSFKRYYSDFPVRALTNWWDDTVQSTFAAENLYVVQTYTKVIQRCMMMCTDPGDLVIDPTCGSGTTAYVAEQWGRRWITIDTSRVALAIARQRLMAARYPYYLLADSVEGRAKGADAYRQSTSRASITNDIRHGFVYDRIQRITLKSITTNPDIRDGMTKEQVDAAIKRHADYVSIYDKPIEDKNKVRVSGPFTVESLTPHRSVTFDDTTPQASRESASSLLKDNIDDIPFEQSILDNLMKAGIQNGKKAERIVLSSIEMYPGSFMQAVATSTESTGESRIGLAIGPQYGTVSPTFVKKAAREAIEAEDIDMLCVLGFAFDPQATNVTKDDGVTVDASDAGFAEVAGQRRLGKVNVLFVRMNSDLLMGEDLKKTGTGNLFTVFGEPDIEVKTDAGTVIVDLRGVDVFDPTTGEVRSGGTDKIALWMIDTNYNEESFFVRHCYFTGGGDPFKKLKSTLKSEINAEAWQSLYSTTSRPFHKPDTGKIAVKVINDYGDEVMKVFVV